MAGIVVFGGTSEGRKMVEYFQNTGLAVHVCVATEYGKNILEQSDNVTIHTGRLTVEEMVELFGTISVDFCVDATHPYAVKVTQNVKKACEIAGLSYLRVARKSTSLMENAGEIYVDNVKQAVDFLNTTTGNILITTGSKELEEFTTITDYQHRCFARVLPTPEVMQTCSKLGFEGKNVIGMQGPFSIEMNEAMLRQIDAAYLVTKESGMAGGFLEKYQAAVRANVNLVIIGRPEEVPDAMELSQAIGLLESHFQIAPKRAVYLIGMGPGNVDLLTTQAGKCLLKCDAVIGAKRMCEIAENIVSLPTYESYQKEEIVAWLRAHPEYRQIAICYSGDIGFYSGANGMRDLLTKELPQYDIIMVGGISSVSYFVNQLGIPGHEVHFVSCHGTRTHLIPHILEHRYVCALLGNDNKIGETCKKLVEFGMPHVKVSVGTNLSYENQVIEAGMAEEFVDYKSGALSVVLFENPSPESFLNHGIADEEFLRDKVPMTKEEIRTISLSKMQLEENSVVYDIGAGTGSISVGAARLCKSGMVYAIEQKPEAVELIRTNAKKFKVENLCVVEGRAPKVLEELPVPTHAFIGGNGGCLMEIIRSVRAKNPDVIFVMNAVSMETLAMLETIKKEFCEYQDMEVLMVQVSRANALGGYHLLQAQNPVYIIRFGGRHVG